MQQGQLPRDVVDILAGADAGQAHRQFNLMGGQGRIAARGGAACVDWCGHIEGPDLSIAGNIVVGTMMLDVTVSAYREIRSLAFAGCRTKAMRAGAAAGGDKRGRQSAGLLICGDEKRSALGLGVEGHGDPFDRPLRLKCGSYQHGVHSDEFPSPRANSADVTERGAINAAIARTNAGNH